MISAVVLAAGKSRRMGRQKLLLPLGGRPVVARVVDQLLASSVDGVWVVVGSDRPGIEAALAGRPVQLVENCDPDSDMLDSVRLGLRALPNRSLATLIVPGDQARISRAVVEPLVDDFRRHGKGIVVPTFQGKRGHPLLFTSDYHEEILSRHDAVGLRGLLEAHPEAIREIPLPAAEVLDDMDLPSDYERIRRFFD